ncbi:NAD(P)/FAD-dependent oxidoreductase [Arthrospiribacter ruber]|uniref:NAD(P)/FAD-dependent oxidoreductase n=1 Tax=Arthrospiribacter ruber TaxID=2487934 RepID=A0A951IVM8_9BACT|nr:NAD(P)/FAD-dependent oxidoreductase [Arthrospiribacter ruber]
MVKLKIGVIGAGAAGYFSAIHAAKNGGEVVILEKTSKVLSKVKISGGGRCNVTHDAREVSKLVKNFPRGEKFLKKTFRHFAVNDTIEWFEKRKVKLKTEPDGRMFPVSDSSQSIIDVLEKEAEMSGVIVNRNFNVASILKNAEFFEVSDGKRKLTFDRIIICSGGSPKAEGFSFIEKVGHTIVPPIPSLFTFNTPEEPIRKLMGISLPHAHVRLEGTKLSYDGPLLITHWGVSGPAVLKLSAFGAKWLHEKDYIANAHIRWVASLSEQDIVQYLQAFKNQHPKKKVASNPLLELPGRLWEHLVQVAEINENLLWQDISKKHFNRFVQNLFCYIVNVKGKTTFKEEFVTAGGVELSEVDPETLESKIVKGLFFAGEVLNIDGITGGFNFQAAWSTGYLAGRNVNRPY